MELQKEPSINSGEDSTLSVSLKLFRYSHDYRNEVSDNEGICGC